MITVTDLSVSFHVGGLDIVAVENVSFEVAAGETFGIVGESGSGKSTILKAIAGLVPSTSTVLEVDGRPAARRRSRADRRMLQFVFQDPYASLNPRHTVGEIVTAGPRAHGEPRARALDRAAAMLKLVGLGEAALPRYPHEFSGGQRQRIGLARALMLEPDVLIADEPVSALDVTVQAQVLDLLDKVRRQMNLAMLFITHDMRVAARICHRVMVMRQGQVVEEGPTGALFAAPRNEYTGRLLAAIPGRQRLEA